MKDRRSIMLWFATMLLGGTFLVGSFVLKNYTAIPRLVKAFSPGTAIIHAEPSTPIYAGNLVNINTATLERLQTLPGIGPAIAQRILSYRAEHGPFTSVAELTKIEGIGINRLENLLGYITTGG